jgi:phosphoribosylanthranilate isomerase
MSPRLIDAVGPFALDICGGVRTDGWLDEAKLSAFMHAARSLTGCAT